MGKLVSDREELTLRTDLFYCFSVQNSLRARSCKHCCILLCPVRLSCGLTRVTGEFKKEMTLKPSEMKT